MQAIRPFIKPVLTATAGAMVGYGLVQKYVNKQELSEPHLRQLLSVLVGIGTPVCFGLSTMPTLLTSSLISAAGTLLLRNVIEAPPPPPPAPKNMKTISDEFSKCFESSDKFGREISEEFTKDFNSLPSPEEKIECIKNIFTAFKNSRYTGTFNNSEIWTFLLTQISNQKDIDDKKQITLDVADGNSGTIDFRFKQLKGFINTFQVSDTVGNFVANKNYDGALSEFTKKLQPKKPFMKILNHGNAHYTAFVIEKNIANTSFLVSHINSNGKQYKSSIFNDRGGLSNYLKGFISKGDNKTESESEIIINEDKDCLFYNTFLETLN